MTERVKVKPPEKKDDLNKKVGEFRVLEANVVPTKWNSLGRGLTDRTPALEAILGKKVSY